MYVCILCRGRVTCCRREIEGRVAQEAPALTKPLSADAN